MKKTWKDVVWAVLGLLVKLIQLIVIVVGLIYLIVNGF